MTDDHDSVDDPMGAPHRPGEDWRCRDDHEEWPCQVFRRRMWTLYRHNRRQLVEVMGRFRDRAVDDLDDLSREQADARFLGWVADPPVRRRLRSV
ncbi:hypothetical protein AB0J90_01635 [Micromonospora sp. NPDC049523]|uniref:hypothetical protein n=1 Tax=Micromonospora sp. NPDC049523 TaxID=3155921 RepID=UPI00342B7BD0